MVAAESTVDVSAFLVPGVQRGAGPSLALEFLVAAASVAHLPDKVCLAGLEVAWRRNEED